MFIVIGLGLGVSQGFSSSSASASLWTPLWGAWPGAWEYGGGGAKVSWLCMLVLTSANLRDWCKKEFDGGSILRMASIDRV